MRDPREHERQIVPTTTVRTHQPVAAGRTLSRRVEDHWLEGRPLDALMTIARAVERLQTDRHAPQEIAPRVEGVLREWGYQPLAAEAPTLPNAAD